MGSKYNIPPANLEDSRVLTRGMRSISTPVRWTLAVAFLVIVGGLVHHHWSEAQQREQVLQQIDAELRSLQKQSKRAEHMKSVATRWMEKKKKQLALETPQTFAATKKEKANELFQDSLTVAWVHQRNDTKRPPLKTQTGTLSWPNLLPQCLGISTLAPESLTIDAETFTKTWTQETKKTDSPLKLEVLLRNLRKQRATLFGTMEQAVNQGVFLWVAQHPKQLRWFKVSILDLHSEQLLAESWFEPVGQLISVKNGFANPKRIPAEMAQKKSALIKASQEPNSPWANDCALAGDLKRWLTATRP